jgi:hypothetical protein
LPNPADELGNAAMQGLDIIRRQHQAHRRRTATGVDHLVLVVFHPQIPIH